MRILIANDDGVYSPGIHALAEVAQQFGDVRVVAATHHAPRHGGEHSPHRCTQTRKAHVLWNGNPALTADHQRVGL